MFLPSLPHCPDLLTKETPAQLQKMPYRASFFIVFFRDLLRGSPGLLELLHEAEMAIETLPFNGCQKAKN
jgi:hypothetical protein